MCVVCKSCLLRRVFHREVQSFCVIVPYLYLSIVLKIAARHIFTRLTYTFLRFGTGAGDSVAVLSFGRYVGVATFALVVSTRKSVSNDQ